jgi:hypothetical protein
LPTVNRLLALNRGGRRLLTATGESKLPLNYWPSVLSRSSENADILFSFRCEKHNVLLWGARSRQRTGGHNDETNS